VYADAPMDGWHHDTKVERITIYPIFKKCGPNCRAAMLVHECAHYVASAKHFAREGPTAAGEPDWPDGEKNADGSRKPRHPRDYAHLKPAEASRNACTYAAFAYHSL